MAMYTTFEQNGKKEDFANTISNITPTKTPFLSSLSTERCHNTLFQWQEDSLASAAKNAQTEGFTPTPKTVTPTVIRNNYTQILEKTVQVSNTANAISVYGRAKEMAYQLALAGAEIKRDLEFSLVGNAQTAAAGDNDSSPAARNFASYQAQIDSSVKLANGGTGRDLTDDLVVDAGEALYETGGEGSILMLKPKDKIRAASFAFKESTTAPQAQRQTSGTRVVNSVDFYQGPLGAQRIVANRLLKSSDALVYDPQMWRLMVLRPWNRTKLAITGDNMSVMIVGEYSLKHRNYKGSALITDLNA